MFRQLSAAACAALFAFVAPARAGVPVPPVEAYGRLPAMDLVRLSPSGDKLAFIVDGNSQRYLAIRTAAGELLLRSEVGTAKVRDLYWAGEDLVLVELTKTYDLGYEYAGKHELSQVLVADLATRKASWVFERGRMVNSVFGVYGLVQHEGRWYGHFGGLALGAIGGGLEDGYVDLYRVDLATGETRLLNSATGQEREWVVRADGAIQANARYDEESGRWRLWAGDDRKQLLVDEADTGGANSLVGLGRSAETLLFKRQDDTGASQYVEVPLAGGAPVVLETKGPVRSLMYDDDGLLIGYSMSGDRDEAVLFSPKLQARYNGTRKAFPAEQVMRLVSWNRAFDRLVVETEGSEDAGTFWVVDIAKGAASELGYAYPEVGAGQVGPVRMIDYKAADGLALRGVLTLPPGREAKNLPVVVLPHGGPQVRDRLGFDWWAQAFAARGYAVFQPNFRGSSGYGPAFVKSGYGEWGRKMQTDVSDGVAALAAQGVVDPKRACVVGASYGGYVALAGVTVQNGLYRCAVAVAGVSDLPAMLRREAERHGRYSDELRYWKTFLGAKSSTDAVLRQLSPTELAARADAPVLLVHGKDDTVVPVEQSRAMQKALRRAGKPVEYVELPGEDHWLSGAATRIEMLKAAVAFVERHNPADPAPATTTAAP